MTNSQIFKLEFPEFIGVVDFFTSDCEQVNFIDVESDTVEFTRTITARCGCCSDIEEREESLSFIMDFMTDDEFQDLILLIKK
jgi:hypothetical protein